MSRRILLSLLALFVLTSCGSAHESKKIKSMQRKDKQLSCKEILLEMNEADFYRKMAHKNKGPKLTSMLMPLGYISTYMSAEEAIDAADARVSYLDQIYEIMRCEEKEIDEERGGGAVYPYPAPMPVVPGPQGMGGGQPYYGSYAVPPSYPMHY